jgi:hypothetical protein
LLADNLFERFKQDWRARTPGLYNFQIPPEVLSLHSAPHQAQPRYAWKRIEAQVALLE